MDGFSWGGCSGLDMRNLDHPDGGISEELLDSGPSFACAALVRLHIRKMGLLLCLFRGNPTVLMIAEFV